MKKLFLILLSLMLILTFAACSQNAGGSEAQSSAEPETNESSAQISEPSGTEQTSSESSEPVSRDSAPSPSESSADEPSPDHSRTLVVVFSATGTTKGVADKIAAIENADLYEIKAAQEYTSDDLNWHDSGSRTSIEQNDKNARPEIGSEPLSLEGYEKIYIGFPIWWGEEPRIMDTFAETYSFDGITMIPFCTSGSSGIGRSGQNLAELSGSGNWLEGKRFGGGVSESDLTEWIGSLNG